MKLRMLLLLKACLSVCLLFSPAVMAETDGIGWIPTWNQAAAEAARTHKPILLVAAAPQCASVPGIW